MEEIEPYRSSARQKLSRLNYFCPFPSTQIVWPVGLIKALKAVAFPDKQSPKGTKVARSLRWAPLHTGPLQAGVVATPAPSQPGLRRHNVSGRFEKKSPFWARQRTAHRWWATECLSQEPLSDGNPIATYASFLRMGAWRVVCSGDCPPTPHPEAPRSCGGAHDCTTGWSRTCTRT
jgi:hypothetical protein